ncbi:MAG: FKBP-type peptidyl-prolyl cis-trans isomerase [Bacteroidales bacterium]|nr:FKBP-type peptidyl-prolyl cis-trans isomerase [Bacteroidales bacterium]MCF8458502.1 FKBP-type peptidyl-prolyl cis-trans isomerase [Bacteroidales bacterium]
MQKSKSYIQLFILFFLSFIVLNGYSQTDEDPYKDFLGTGSGLKIKITYPGDGPFPQTGDQVLVHYTGKLLDGTVFDSSVERKKPFTFQLGVGQVIKGWDEGIALLKKGGYATLYIPPELAYGDREMGAIPANSPLIFDVQLVDFKSPPPTPAEPQIVAFDTQGKDTLTTPSGLQYIVVEKGNGEKTQAGRNVKINYSGYLKDGKMFDSTFKRNEAFKMMAGAGKVIKGLDEGVMLMQVGDKFRLIIPPPLAFGEKETSVIPAHSTLIFDVELLEIEPPIVIKPFNIEGKKMYTTESGLQYYIIEEGKGEKPKAGDNVAMHYTGYLQDGTIFDSSVKRDEEFVFPLGQARVIKGWEEAVAMMNVGDKLRLILPPELAYGERSMGIIPANATLIFDVELLGIRK